MNDIITENIAKSFGEKKVLDGFSYTFRGGEVTCIQGTSGSGKTTLLNIIAGIDRNYMGNISGVPDKISFVFQEDRLCESFSAVSNVRLVCGRGVSDETIKEHLKRLDIADFENSVSRFSGGMKRRVAIVRAILYDAGLVILDEPFKGLNEELKYKTMDYVKENTAGKTVICVTHDSREAEYLGGKLLIL